MASNTLLPGLGGKDRRGLVPEPAPGFRFRGAGGLADDDFESRKFRLYLRARQQVQAADKHGSLDNGCLRPVEALKRGMRAAVGDAAHESRPEYVLSYVNHDKFEVRERRF